MRAAQEAYVWPAVAEAARRVIAIRYSLLTYIYTLFYHAHTRGDTVLRALAWEFANDESLRATDNQFMLGSALLITPVLNEGSTSVKGVLPGISEDTRWYDWYNLQEVTSGNSSENITMEAPLEHINVHVRGGSILTLQEPGYTTRETREGLYSIVVALDGRQEASGDLYLDDGESIEQDATKMVQVSNLQRPILTYPRVLMTFAAQVLFEQTNCQHPRHVPRHPGLGYYLYRRTQASTQECRFGYWRITARPSREYLPERDFTHHRPSPVLQRRRMGARVFRATVVAGRTEER